MRALTKSFPLAALVAGILILMFNPNASAQTSSAPGPLAQKVAAKLEGGKTLATASAPEIRQAVEDAAAENVGSAAEMAVEVLQYLAAIKGGLTEKFLIAVVKGAFAGSPTEVPSIAEAVIAAFPNFRETVLKLLRNSVAAPGTAGIGDFASGPEGVGGMPDDNSVTPDQPE